MLYSQLNFHSYVKAKEVVFVVFLNFFRSLFISPMTEGVEREIRRERETVPPRRSSYCQSPSVFPSQPAQITGTHVSEIPGHEHRMFPVGPLVLLLCHCPKGVTS